MRVNYPKAPLRGYVSKLKPMERKEKFNRLLFWTGWCALLIFGVSLLNPFWTVAFVAVWIVFGIYVYWADTHVEVEDEEMDL